MNLIQKITGSNKEKYTTQDLLDFANYCKNELITNKYTPLTESEIKGWQDWKEKEAERIAKAEEESKKRLEAVKSGQANELVR